MSFRHAPSLCSPSYPQNSNARRNEENPVNFAPLGLTNLRKAPEATSYSAAYAASTLSWVFGRLHSQTDALGYPHRLSPTRILYMRPLKKCAVPDRLAYGIHETAAQLSCGRDTVFKLIREKRLVAIKLGRRTVITRTSIDELLNGR
jgi:excisionase family DNA binding protein